MQCCEVSEDDLYHSALCRAQTYGCQSVRDVGCEILISGLEYMVIGLHMSLSLSRSTGYEDDIQYRPQRMLDVMLRYVRMKECPKLHSSGYGMVQKMFEEMMTKV